jgi:hypothetical protein
MRTCAPFLVLLTLTLGLAACGGGATVSESQCIAGDWRTIGYRDGADGARSTRLLDHQNACVPHGIVPDRNDYMAGWNEGVLNYCTVANAFTVGEHGGGHHNACPPDLRDEFVTAYQDGRALYLKRAEIRELTRTLARNDARSDELRAGLVGTATAQLDASMTPASRNEYLAALGRLADEKNDLENARPGLEHSLALRKAELEALTRTLASIY